jgi:hypothetical protein
MFGRILAAAVLAAAIIATGTMPVPMRAAQAACEPGDKIDSTTADQARKKIEAAGYRKVRALKKGCDNTWHGTAEKNGAATGIALTATGEVFPESE